MRAVPLSLLLGPVFDALPIGVVVLDSGGLVRLFNRYEEQLANRQRERVIGRSFFDEVAPCMNVKELAGEFFDNVHATNLHTEVEFAFAFPHAPQPRNVLVRMQSVIVEREPHALLVVEDVSAKRAVERLKETLATLLVHDFKNPLSVISANLDFIREVMAPLQNPALEALDDSVLATKQLHGMILNLLDIARLETGTFGIVRVPVDVVALVVECARGGAAIVRDARVEVVADLPRELEARIDATAVRRALSNLLDNAIRHSPSGSRIVISAALESSELVLTVADQGSGVPPELRDAIFEKFAQGDATNRAASNRGLGLTFVRMVARAHGGEISVSDNTPRGARFSMRLVVS